MVTFLGERTGIGGEPEAVQHLNLALPSRLDVANVTTADPGVQVENVSARGRRTRYQRVPGSPRRYSALSSLFVVALSVPSITASATLRIVRRRSIDVFWIQRNACGSVSPCSDCSRPLARSSSLRTSRRSLRVLTSSSRALISVYLLTAISIAGTRSAFVKGFTR